MGHQIEGAPLIWKPILRKNDLNLEMGFGGTWNNFRKPKSEVEVNKTSDNKPLYKNFRDFFLHLLTNIMCFVSCSIPILFILFCIWIVAVIDSTYSLFWFIHNYFCPGTFQKYYNKIKRMNNFGFKIWNWTMIRRWSLRIEKFVQWQLPFIWLISPVSHGNPTDDITDNEIWNSNAESVRFHIRVAESDFTKFD